MNLHITLNDSVDSQINRTNYAEERATGQVGSGGTCMKFKTKVIKSIVLIELNLARIVVTRPIGNLREPVKN